MSKKKKKNGRPSKYNNKYCAMIVAHFSGPTFERYIKSERITNKKNGTTEHWFDYGYRCTDMPTLDDFAFKIGVDDDTLANWASAKYPKDYKIKSLQNQLKHPKFFGAYNRAKKLQKAFLNNNALKGFSPPASFIFIAKNVTDMRDKQEVDHTSKGKEIAGFNYIIPTPTKTDGTNNTGVKAIV